ncbi:MAG: DUF1837 domain-containing protein [Geobacter sp.]|nr:DUF1837 domain-containing protein [Geobacter sp.]
MADSLQFEEIAKRLARMCSQKPTDLAAYFLTADKAVTFKDTQTTARCHVLRRDGNGAPRVNGLASLLGHKVVDYAMPRRDIKIAAEAFRSTRSTAGFVALAKKASRLFTHIKETGEGGELLLYLLAEAYLGFPQVISKMHLKTNPQVHYHGVDGVHASVDPVTGLLALWWGESKLYASLRDGIRNCLDSISQYVVPDAPDGSPVERDIDLLSAYADIIDPNLLAAFKKYLNPDDPHFNKVQYRGICLVGFDLNDYPKAESEDPVKFSGEVISAVQSWKETTRRSVLKHQLHQTVLEVFLIPFPSVEELRASFLRTLGIQE